MDDNRDDIQQKLTKLLREHKQNYFIVSVDKDSDEAFALIDGNVPKVMAAITDAVIHQDYFYEMFSSVVELAKEQRRKKNDPSVN